MEGYEAISRVRPDEFFDELPGLGYDLFTLSEATGRSKDRPTTGGSRTRWRRRRRDGFIDLVAYPR